MDSENVIDIKKIVNLKPSNNLWKELGNNTYAFDEALSELIDNSISASDKSIECIIEIEFYLGNSEKATEQIFEKLIVRDNSSGIKEDDIPICFTPAGKQTKRSLNEHGLGFKQSISTLGSLVYFKSKYKNEQGFLVKKFDFDLEIFEDDFTFENGTEICINPEGQKISTFNINSSNYESKIKSLEYLFGARYRYLLSKNNIKLKLVVINNIVNKKYEKIISPIFPIYYHPQIFGSKGKGGTAKAIVHEKEFNSSNGSKALLTFGYHPKDSEEYQRIGEEEEIYKSKTMKGKWNKHVNHPYSWSPSSQGLDIIMNDRVIKFHQLSEIGLYGTRENWYNSVRGELKLISGFKTTSTKNEVIRTEEYDEILEQIRFYLSNGTDNDIPNEEKDLWKNEFNRNLLSYAKEMLKKSDDEIEYASEDELKEKIEKYLRNPLSKFKEINREYTIEALGVIADFIVDGEPWEVKNVEATTHDISQLLTYMLSMRVKFGTFVAPSYAKGCDYLIKIIESEIGYKITTHKSSIFN